MKAKSAKAKGTKLEKWVADQLNKIGVPAGKQPGSGIYQDFPHDVRAMLRDGPFIVECKSWKHGWRTGDNAMGQADILVIKRDHGTPCVYMPWEFFARLVALTQDGGDDSEPVEPTPPPRPLRLTGAVRTRQLEPAEKTTLLEVRAGAGGGVGRVNVPQSFLTGEPKPKTKPRRWR